MSENKLEVYIAKDPRLAEVNELARQKYAQANKVVHNHQHALWDTENAILIGENEGNVNLSILISAGLMHDTGVAEGPYKDHAVNSGIIVRRELPALGFAGDEVEKIASAVEQHAGSVHTSTESQYLYDADTLNKAGVHGIEQYLLIQQEFNLSLPQLIQRGIRSITEYVKKGYYSQTARKIDKEMGNGQLGGLEVSLEFIKKVGILLREGRLSEQEIIEKAKQLTGIKK